MLQYCDITKRKQSGGGMLMVDYQKLYHLLFNAMTDTLDALEEQNFGQAKTLLRQAQLDAEEVYLTATEEEAVSG